MSRIFGEFIYNLPLERQRKSFSTDLVQFYTSIYKSPDLEVRKNAAFNLPCFYYYYGNMEEFIDINFQEVFHTLSNDESIEVRIIVAKGIHESITLLDK